MTTATQIANSVLSIEEAAVAKDGERQNVRLRTELGLQAFGVNAVRAPAAGTDIIGEHDEAGPGADRHEELYLVLAGHATFTVDGTEIDAPQGTAVAVRDPESKRGAVAKEDGTIIVAVGAPAGRPFRPTAGEAMRPFFEPYTNKDYEAALAVAEAVLRDYPGNGLPLYNIACMEALLGRHEEALGHLREALEAAPRLRENARTDDDFVSLRGDERFESLLGN